MNRKAALGNDPGFFHAASRGAMLYNRVIKGVNGKGGRMEDTLKVICTEDCGNAPRKQLLKDVKTAWAKKDTSFVLAYLAEDIHWEIPGKNSIHGKDPFALELEKQDQNTITELHLQTIITHGKTAAVNGTITEQNGKQLAFCDVFHFTSAGKKAPIKEIISYVLPL
ncbi:nuclear transport factor 2 family protein [Halobacillus salinarum]|uniref:Nuclear transport factor 2 family protein n=1 Tax=Halobacillus salinarum TaxID=2932257 RepID=A0ABY4EM49_9BACI|nr:nuclear transport factor 2 family protein [Halobacillus salinarum]UOQ44729.1 nuclear transport factor 2 family protein [Halobacillus salinarum]